MTGKHPTLYLSHGSPGLILDDGPSVDFLRGLAGELSEPDAILCISAHWMTDVPTLSLARAPETIHDFGGFPDALYEMRYDVPGAPAIAEEAAKLLRAAGIPVGTVANRGLDHGAWVPLKMAYPAAEIPVTQLSLPALWPAAALRDLGRALSPLRQRGVLIVASGSAVHNLGELQRGGGPTPEWAQAFEDWLCASVEAGDEQALVDSVTLAPHYQRAHPSDEHFRPLFVALGAGGPAGRVLHRGFMHGALSMAAFAWQ